MRKLLLGVLIVGMLCTGARAEPKRLTVSELLQLSTAPQMTFLFGVFEAHSLAMERVPAEAAKWNACIGARRYPDLFAEFHRLVAERPALLTESAAQTMIMVGYLPCMEKR